MGILIGIILRCCRNTGEDRAEEGWSIDQFFLTFSTQNPAGTAAVEQKWGDRDVKSELTTCDRPWGGKVGEGSSWGCRTDGVRSLSRAAARGQLARAFVRSAFSAATRKRNIRD